ncbi:MAG: hypothetical protein JWP61_1712 [Friedmanniella sp.]|nr:hypothetical protein [Friedmanniella sp.]
MIFRRDKKRRDEVDQVEADVATDPTEALPADASGESDLTALDGRDWRSQGPWDIAEVPVPEEDEDLEEVPQPPKIDLGSLIVTGVPGSELRLQVSEESQQIVSAMLVMETAVEPTAASGQQTQVYSSALEIGAYAAPRSGGLWTELRDEISASAVEAGGSASLAEGPFGVELRRLVPVTTPDGEEGYQPSKMWVAEGPRWLLRGIVYGQAAIEEGWDNPVVADVVSAFRQVVVRRGDEAMAPGDLLPLAMPAGLVTDDQS